MLHIKINAIFSLILNVFVTQISFKFHVRQVSFQIIVITIKYFTHPPCLYVYIYIYIYMY